MPTLQELVQTIKEDHAPTYSTTKIRGYIDRLQRAVFQRDAAQFKYLNASDTIFPYPILKTEGDKLSYDITASTLVDTSGAAHTPTVGGQTVTCRKVVQIFIMVNSLSNSNYDRKWYGEQFNITGLNQYWSQRLYRTGFFEVPCRIYNKSNGFNARVQFFEDPGTYTDRYYVNFYYAPVELTSNSIPMFLSIDDWEEAFIDGVVGYIENIAGPSEKLNKWQNYWMPRIIADYNDGMDQENPEQMYNRECG